MSAPLDLLSCFQDILDNYAETLVSHPVPRKDLAVCESLTRIAAILEETCHRRGLLTVSVKPSWGLGRWNPTPWVALLDRRVTETTQKAFYPVFLFRSDGSGVYLSLDLGTGRARGSPTNRELADLKACAERLSKYFAPLESSGFRHLPVIDLRRARGVAIGFASGSIVHKFYSIDSLPTLSEMLADIEALIEEYDKFCSSQERMELFYFIQSGESDPVVATVSAAVRPRKNTQGFLGDSQLRRIVEEFATRRAVEHFQREGYQVTDVHMHKPYDLLCERGGERLTVEIKGTTSDGLSVLLTRGEVEHARTHAAEAVLFVCSEIALNVNDDGGVVATGGKQAILKPWRIPDALLSPIAYSYRLPGGDAAH